MHSFRLCRSVFADIIMFGALCVAGASASAQTPANPSAHDSNQVSPQDDSGLKLPPGFCATVFADGVGHARHLAVAPNGVVDVNTWSGPDYGSDPPHAAGFLGAPGTTTGRGRDIGT